MSYHNENVDSYQGEIGELKNQEEIKKLKEELKKTKESAMDTIEKAHYYRKESDYYQEELRVLKERIEKTKGLLEILFNDKLPDFRRVQAEVKLKAMIKEL